MNPKRKKKLSERDARLQKLRQRFQSVETLSGKDANLQREVDYIVRRAGEHDARCVGFGELMLFSTQSGDAWMLDPGDALAVCLARAGVSQPVRIMSTDTYTIVEWDHTYSMVEDRFTIVEKKSGRVTTILGYPTQAILAAIESARELRDEMQ